MPDNLGRELVAGVGDGLHGAALPRIVPTRPSFRDNAPALNPIERVWLYLRERYLSHRLLADYAAVVDACCEAWNALAAEKGRIQSLTSYPYHDNVSS
jgi:hypothetical protein